MKRIWPVILVLAAMVLAACDGGQSPIKSAATATPAPQPTTAAPAAQPTQAIPPTPTPLPNGCQVTSLLPDWDPVFPAIKDTDWQKGPKDAMITILEYSDYQCPYCAQVAPVLDDLLVKFPKDVRLVYRHFPLNIHDKSIASAQAAEAAGLQGKFWEMHSLLLSKQAEWSGKNPQDFSTWLNTQAKTISGLDAAKFMQDLLSKPISEKVATALKSAEDIGLNQTPFLILNGRAFGGNPDEATIGAVLKMFKQVTSTLEPLRVRECPAQTVDKSKQYTATVSTTKGEFTIKLFADKAPLTVNSFVFLAKRGWFDNIPFHRVVEGFVAQTGDPSGTGMGNPGYQFNNEINADLKYDKAGMVGMANSGPNTNGSQFFISLAPIPQLNGSYTIFGEVTSGLEVLKQLTIRDPQIGDSNVPDADKILKISIDVK
jgi:cyclophilin family peptidyl-prolyl cis-trans isomerase/protein-disulfide isomerase